MAITPYQRLFDKIVKYVGKMTCRRVKSAFVFPIEKIKDPSHGFTVLDIYHAVLAAKTLGYETILEATGKGLEVKYREQISIPAEWQ